MKPKLTLFLFSLIFVLPNLLSSQSVYDNAKQHPCLKCHSSQIISYHNDISGKVVKRLMNPYYIMDTLGIKNGVHKNFDCIDCHSVDYSVYPHIAELKFESRSICIDCHGGDPTYATYQFDRIDEEFKKSIHFQISGEDFTCTKCHNQHTYHPTARNSENVLEIVEYSNSLCLSCHNNMNKYELVSGHENPKLIEVHNWLPNQELHFQHIRYIEYHTEVANSLMVSHNILSKSKAVKKCAECHNINSRLKASLYKYSNFQKRNNSSSFKSILSNNSYIIKSQQFPFLKMLSLVIFSLTVTVMLIHLVFRYLKK